MLWWSADIDDYVINNSKVGQIAYIDMYGFWAINLVYSKTSHYTDFGIKNNQHIIKTVL